MVADVDLVAVHILDDTVAFRRHQHAAVASHLALESGADDRAVRAHERNGLAHHVRAHQRTVGVVVLEEGNQRGGDGRNLVRRHVDVLDLLRRHQWEVTLEAGLDDVVLERAVIVEAHRRLRDDGAVLLLGGQVGDALSANLGYALLDFAVRRLDEPEAVHLGVHAKGADQTNVRSFRRLDGAEATVVRVVHVTDLKTGALTGETTGTEGRDAALVRHLAQRVGLVHELAQLVRSEERVDHGAQRLGVDEVGRGEHLVVAHVHALADRPGHPGETHTELVVELLAHRPDAAVGEVVDVVHIGLRVHEVDEELDDEDDVILGQGAGLLGHVDAELPVDPEPAHLTEVVALLGEEQLVDHTAGGVHVRRLCIPQLTVDVFHGLLLRVGRVLLEGVVDDGVIRLVDVLLVEDDVLGPRVDDELDVLLLQHGVTVEHELVPLDADHLAGVLVHEVLNPGLQHTGGQTAAEHTLHPGLRDLHLLREVEDAQDVTVGFIADGAQQRGDGKLLLPVDVRVHDAVDVGGEFNPAALERNDPRAVQLGSVGVTALAEEYARGAVKLVDDDALRSVDHERAARGHVRNGAEVHVLHDGLEVLVLGVGTVEFEFGLQRNAVGQAPLDALFDAVARGIDEVVEELQHELVARVRDGEVLIEHLEETLALPVLRLGLQLEELAEGAELNVEEVRIGEVRGGGGERMSLLQLGRQHGVRLLEEYKSQRVQVGFGGVPRMIQGTRRSDRDLRPA